MSTATAIEWDKAKVFAPDAEYQVAKAHFDVATQILTVENRVNTVVGRYQLSEHTHSGDVLFGRGKVADSEDAAENDIRVEPDPRCTCAGYKKRAKK